MIFSFWPYFLVPFVFFSRLLKQILVKGMISSITSPSFETDFSTNSALFETNCSSQLARKIRTIFHAPMWKRPTIFRKHELERVTAALRAVTCGHSFDRFCENQITRSLQRLVFRWLTFHCSSARVFGISKNITQTKKLSLGFLEGKTKHNLVKTDLQKLLVDAGGCSEAGQTGGIQWQKRGVRMESGVKA